MTSHTTAQFRERLAALPIEVQRQADAAYRLFRADPRHRSLDFKRVHTTDPVYSARVGIHYRAIAWRDGNSVLWFWIGSHAEYDALLSRL